MLNFFIGRDEREIGAYQVCARSITRHCFQDIDVRSIDLPLLRGLGLYTRAVELRAGRLYDPISAAAMSTEFAIARFMVPMLMRRQGWALFCDADFLFRADPAEIFALADPQYAVMVVKHDHRPAHGLKMDLQEQAHYSRKNWSSLILWNCAHPAHGELTLSAINEWPGRELHAFKWLDDALIGELPAEWNWLEGWSNIRVNPKAVHFTDGTPNLPGRSAIPYAQEWWSLWREVEGVKEAI